MYTDANKYIGVDKCTSVDVNKYTSCSTNVHRR